jgi:hypothetical protein
LDPTGWLEIDSCNNARSRGDFGGVAIATAALQNIVRRSRALSLGRMLASRLICGTSTARQRAEFISDFDRLSFGTLRVWSLEIPPRANSIVCFDLFAVWSITASFDGIRETFDHRLMCAVDLAGRNVLDGVLQVDLLLKEQFVESGVDVPL